MKNDIFTAVDNVTTLLHYLVLERFTPNNVKKAYGVLNGLLEYLDEYNFEKIEGVEFEKKTADEIDVDECFALADMSLECFCDIVADDIYSTLQDYLQERCNRAADFSNMETWYNFTDCIRCDKFAVLLYNHLVKEHAVCSSVKTKYDIEHELTVIKCEYPISDLAEYVDNYACNAIYQALMKLDD